MATVIAINNGPSGYRDIIDHVLRFGENRSPRGIETLDVANAIIQVSNPADALPVGTGRKLNLRIAATEAIQLIGGFTDPELMFAASQNFRRYAEPDNTLYGAYGTRVGNQAAEVVRKLQKDPSTRQAVVTLWDADLDNDPGHLDYPCTVALHFAIRNDALDMTTFMRSNDVWLGLPYDLFQFTQLQMTIARALQAPFGVYTHHAASLHLYKTDLPVVERITSAEPNTLDTPLGIGTNGMNMSLIAQRAQMLPYLHDVGTMYPTASEVWYHKVLTSDAAILA